MRKQKKKIKTLFEEVQLDAGRVEARVVQDGSKHITKCLNSPPPPLFFKQQHCAAVVKGNIGASLTERQSNATLWTKLCLISSRMQESDRDKQRLQSYTNGEEKVSGATLQM